MDVLINTVMVHDAIHASKFRFFMLVQAFIYFLFFLSAFCQSSLILCFGTKRIGRVDLSSALNHSYNFQLREEEHLLSFFNLGVCRVAC